MTTIRAVRFPETDAAAIEEHAAAHGDAAEALGAMPDALREVSAAWLRQQAETSLAAIRPSFFAGDAPPLFPAPRGYLDSGQRGRLAGVRMALQHVEARLIDAKGERPLIDASTPFVLNALAEGRRDRRSPMYPGLVRSSDTTWLVRDPKYKHPSAHECGPLVDVTLEAFDECELHPAVAGAWLMFSLLTIHPFADGNGRTTRMLYLLASAPATGLDLSIAEQWVFYRHQYIRALSVGRAAPRFDADRLDPQPFTDATIAWSTVGARLTSERLAALGRAWDGLAGLDDAHRAGALAAGLHRFVSPDDLPATIGTYPDRLDVLLRLVGAGVLTRVTLPPSRQVPGAPPRPHFAATPQTIARLDQAIAQAPAAGHPASG